MLMWWSESRKGLELMINIENDNLPVVRSTITEMVQVYLKVNEAITAALGVLKTAEETFSAAFPDSYFRIEQSKLHLDRPSDTREELKKQAWRSLVKKMEIRRILSIKRSAELDKQMETGEGLPEITEVNILAMMEGTLNNAGQFLEEAVTEVFDWLRPKKVKWGTNYKTNDEFQIGRRVILKWVVEQNYCQVGGFRVNYQREKELTALDNVFHALDGKGQLKTYHGPLWEAISKSGPQGTGQTDYFKFRACINRNLHLEFRRMDLVNKLNAIAGGNRLRAPKQEVA